MSQLIALLLVLPSLAFARAPEAKTTVLTVKPGKNILIQISPPATADKAAFLFLPGVNRSLLLSEPGAQKLISQGYGVVAFNFSVQPLSVATLENGTRPAFLTEDATLESLAEETHKVAAYVKREYGIRLLLPVSLSYSGAVSRHLKNFMNVVDSVPLTSMDAFSPNLVMYRNWLKAQAMVLDPMGMLGYVRYWLDVAYKNQWSQQVNAMLAQFELPDSRRSDMIEGYTQLSRATEGFDWNNAGDRVKRTFVIAAKENPVLLRHQLETILERVSGRLGESVVLVEESGHIVPADQPEVYAQILVKMANNELKAGLTVVKPSAGTWTNLTPAQSEVRIREMLRDLPGIPNESRNSPGDGGVDGTL